jgi:xylan 1,4-beta-xylosidase
MTQLRRLPRGAERARVSEYRIDEKHGDAYTVWKEMGSPQEPSTEQVEKLGVAGQVQPVDLHAESDGRSGDTSLSFELPREGMSLICLDWGKRAR